MKNILSMRRQLLELQNNSLLGLSVLRSHFLFLDRAVLLAIVGELWVVTDLYKGI